MRRLLMILGSVLIPALTVLAQLPPSVPEANSGSMVISGDTNLVPLTQNILTIYTLEGYTGNASISAAAMADAFAGLCVGSVDIALASRAITQDEQNACFANSRTPTSFPIATDALVIVTSPQNAFLQSLTTAQLQAAFSTALNWVDVDPTFPNEPINRYLPDTNSADFVYFVNAVFGGDNARALTATNLMQNADANSLLQTLSTDTNAIGIFGASIANRNTSLARSLSLDGVAPTTQNVTGGIYTLSRALTLVAARETFTTKPQVADFINYAIDNADSDIAPLGLYPVSAANQQAAQQAWLVANGAQASATPTQALPTLGVPTAIGAVPLPPTATIAAPVVQQTFQADTLTLLVNARTDLETLAANQFGIDRPDGWSGSLDTNDPQLAVTIRLDLETMATALLGERTRPAGWFGAVPSTLYAIARDIRHDLELLADTLVAANERPEGWQGGAPILSCNRSTQTLAYLLERGGVYTVRVDPTDPDYCRKVEQGVSVYSELALLSSPIDQAIFSAQTQANLPGAQTIDSEFAVAFFDRGASQRAGLIPLGAAVTGIARSPSQFSNMLLIEGSDFLLFVDFNDTTLTEDQFRGLPNADSVPTKPYCNADFCSGG